MENNKTSPAIDLVIVIDTSDSMDDDAAGLSKAAEKAIESTRTSCPSDLRVVWLGIEGTWKNTKFDRTVRKYLTKQCNVSESDIKGRKWDEYDSITGQQAREDGAPTMEDIANHFDWRDGAQRAMFYLSDEPLKGGGKTVDQEDIDAANQAIETANKEVMVIHTYLAEKEDTFTTELIKEYARVAQKTQGYAFTAKDSFKGFADVLKKIVCQTREVAIKETSPVNAEAEKQPAAAKIPETAELSTSAETSPEKSKKPVSATGSSTKEPEVLIDLVLIADTDGSMKNEAQALFQAADNAINSVKKKHANADFKITWLGVSGTWQGTKVAQTFQDYLSKTVNVMESALLGKKTGESKAAESYDNGALAIANIASHFNWRPETTRTLFYLSQQGLHGSDKKPSKAEVDLTKEAISKAKQANVIVYSYFGGTKGQFIADLKNDYAKLAAETGGLAFNDKDAKQGFATLFESVVNTAYDRGCQIAISYSTGSTEEYAKVAESMPSYTPTGKGGNYSESVTKDKDVVNLETTIDRLQEEWRDARISIRKLGLESGMGSFGETTQGLINWSKDSNKELSKPDFSVQWENRYKETQEAYFAVQRLVAEAQVSIAEVTQFVSIKSEAKETINAGQNALSAWFSAVESSFSRYESMITVIFEALNQAQTALSQIQPIREMGLAEHYALWARIGQLEKLQNQFQHGDSEIQTSLLEVQKEKETSKAEVSKLNNQITDLGGVIQQLKDSETALQAALAKAEKGEKDVKTEHETFKSQVTDLKTEASTYKGQYEALQAEIKRVEDLRAKVQAELTEWENKYVGAQKELNGLKIELGKVTVARADQQESFLEPLKLQIQQLQTERDNALSLKQDKVANLNTEIQGWKDRYKGGQEDNTGLREEMERLKLQLQEISISAEGFEAERENMMAQISELRKTVTIRESNVDELQLELAQAVEAQKLLISERGQWDQRYNAALQEVQAKITRIQAASDAETVITETTTVKKSSGAHSSSASASISGSASGSSASYSSSSKKRK